jgi:hypothetical protein
MSFWIKRTAVGAYTINDLGLTVEGGGAELDLHPMFPYEVLQDSANLATALAAGSVDRITGPGGTVIAAVSAFADSVAPHVLNNVTAHSGQLDITQLKRPVHTFTVGSQGCDYTTIKAAVDAAIAGGATVTDPYDIVVYPGLYVEDPITLQDGILIGGLYSAPMDSVFVVASTPNADLFTCTGGYVVGLNVSGVTDPAKCLFRCATPYSLVVLHSLSLVGCSNGVIASDGASVLMTNLSIAIVAPGIEVGVGVTVSGAGTYFALMTGFFSVPEVILPYYVVNPIQTCFKIDAASAYLSGCLFRVAALDTTADCVLADNGATVSLVSSEATGCNNALHVGSTGAGTNIVCSSSVFTNNTLNVKIDSSTGTVFANFSADQQRYSGVTGAKQSGMVQYRDTDASTLFGAVKYQFESGKQVDLRDYFADFSATGVCEDGLVTAGTGLHVDVEAGDGWVRRSADEDAFWVTWDAVTALDLTASTVNYVYYDSATSAVVVAGSEPGNEGILLATVVTNGSGIRFLHNTRVVVDNHIGRMHQYLLDTRKLALKSGLGVTAGTGGRQFTIGSGAYYVALSTLSYVGATDATFSYFYGTNGATEVASQTQVSNTQYDNAGTLTSMTAGYYRSDTVILTSDGRVSVIYGTAQYSTQLLASETATGNTPTFLDPTSFPLARLIVQEAGNIVSFIDIRPQPATGGSGGAGGVTVHAALSGLSADDHGQYLLASGGRTMTGGLNMGTYAITNVGNVDGVDVSAHASRHQPGGTDAISTGTPTGILVAATADAGSASSLAKSDHQHGIATGTPSSIGTGNDAGSSSSVPRLDHVHNHGSQSTGTHHAAVTTSVNGFMSAVDKIVFDDLAEGRTIITCRNETGSTIPKGTLVASAGWSGTYGCSYLVVADKDDGDKRPAIGITSAAIADSTNGPVLISGVLDGLDTSAFAVTDQLVLGSAGAFSRPPPDVDPFTGEIQNVASVVRVHATDGQVILIPDGLNVVTASQVFALTGTSGTPSKTNKYVTDSDARNTDSRTPTAHSSTHDLGSSDGLTARQLAWFLDEGPGEGFASGAYKEITGGVFPTSVIWYDSAGVGKKKVVETTITRNANQTPATIAWKVYNASEVLLRTITDTFSYSGILETSRTRTVV